jgi:hypothetical protein
LDKKKIPECCGWKKLKTSPWLSDKFVFTFILDAITTKASHQLAFLSKDFSQGYSSSSLFTTTGTVDVSNPFSTLG